MTLSEESRRLVNASERAKLCDNYEFEKCIEWNSSILFADSKMIDIIGDDLGRRNTHWWKGFPLRHGGPPPLPRLFLFHPPWFLKTVGITNSVSDLPMSAAFHNYGSVINSKTFPTFCSSLLLWLLIQIATRLSAKLSFRYFSKVLLRRKAIAWSVIFVFSGKMDVF